MTTTAKLFKNGRSQAVRLPREFRFEGDRVRVRRAGARADSRLLDCQQTRAVTQSR